MDKDIKKKIKDLASIKTISLVLKKKNKKIVLCHGDFDLLHTGHLNYFLEAKKNGEILIVSVTSAKFINKGPGRPINDDYQRIFFLANLEIIDFVILSNDFNSVNVIKAIKPDYYIKGNDYYLNKKNIYYSKNLELEKKSTEKYGGKLLFTRNQTRSSSSIINNNLLDKDVIDKIKKIKNYYNYEEFLEDIEILKKLKILVIGETIIDEYIYTSPLGKPSKENIIATEYFDKKVNLGGIFTAFNTFKAFNNNVDCITAISNENKIFFKEKINKMNNKKLILNSKFNTTKTRFVQKNSKNLNKLFEMYNNNYIKISKKNEKIICKYLKEKLNTYDLVLVNDYGHGFLSNEIIKILIKKSKFLSINTQINAGNNGLNLITKYRDSDFACIDEMEALRAINIPNLKVNELISNLHKKINSKNICITLGSRGSCIQRKGSHPVFCPSLTATVVDTVGAGDTFFVISSLFLNIKKSNEIATFLGNVGGAIAVNKENSDAISSKEVFMSYVETLLK